MRLIEWESPGLSANRNSKDAGRRRANKDELRGFAPIGVME
jgi:hypothetical protein